MNKHCRTRYWLSALMLSACGDAGSASDRAPKSLAEQAQPLSYATAGVWSTRSIPVCWEGAPSAFIQEKSEVQRVVVSTWANHSAIDFPTGPDGKWPSCTASSVGIRLTPSTVDGTVALGQTAGVSRVTLNFNPPTTKCGPGGGLSCITFWAAHEFGHALAFAENPICGAHGPAGDATWWNEVDTWGMLMSQCVPSYMFTPREVLNVVNLYGPERGMPIQHSGGGCMRPNGNLATPPEHTDIIMGSDCALTSPRVQFELTSTGQLRHTATGMCLRPVSDPSLGASSLVLRTDCSSAATQFQATSAGSLRHVASNKCVQPFQVGWGTPASVVVTTGCDVPHTQFKPRITAGDAVWPAHVAGLRVVPRTVDSSGVPTSLAPAVLRDDFGGTAPSIAPEPHRFLPSGSLSYKDRCLTANSTNGNNPPNNTPLVYSIVCNDPVQAFEVTLRGSLRHVASGKCVHPRNGAEKPALGTQLVLHDGCDLERLRFANAKPNAPAPF